MNWDALADADVDQETKVTVQFRNAMVKKALRAVLHSIGAMNNPLGYAIVDGTLRISTLADLAHITEVHVYNCEDLIQRPLTPDQRQIMESVIRERLVGSGHTRFEQALATTMDALRKEAAQNLIALITTNVEPGTWESEGTIGSISQFDGLIIVRHNAAAQEDISDLLTMLREARGARQVSPARSGG